MSATDHMKGSTVQRVKHTHTVKTTAHTLIIEIYFYLQIVTTLLKQRFFKVVTNNRHLARSQKNEEKIMQQQIYIVINILYYII